MVYALKVTDPLTFHTILALCLQSLNPRSPGENNAVYTLIRTLPDRESSGARLLPSRIHPHPNPLPEYRERENTVTQASPLQESRATQVLPLQESAGEGEHRDAGVAPTGVSR